MTDRRHVSRPRRSRSESLAWMLLPALATVVGLWLALVYVLTGGAA
ncbi:MAG: hypothetical protein V4515_12295 [Chloroflexota bacterium]